MEPIDYNFIMRPLGFATQGNQFPRSLRLLEWTSNQAKQQAFYCCTSHVDRGIKIKDFREEKRMASVPCPSRDTYMTWLILRRCLSICLTHRVTQMTLVNTLVLHCRAFIAWRWGDQHATYSNTNREWWKYFPYRLQEVYCCRPSGSDEIHGYFYQSE